MAETVMKFGEECRLSEDRKSCFDSRGNEWALRCHFCDRPTRSGVDLCWKCERAGKHLNG